eukprot:12420163-Karenia_brevis.AAC.1
MGIRPRCAAPREGPSKPMVIGSAVLPMHVLQTWEAGQYNMFRAVAKNFGAFARILANLKTERGRKSILQCIKDQIPLHGKDSAPGIPECQAVVMEMKRLSQ